MITARNLSAGYRRNSDVLAGMDFDLQPGLVHGLIGRNGTGKTTLLRVLAGQLAHRGDLRVFGEEPFDNAAVMDRLILAGIDAPLPERWSVPTLLDVAAARWATWDHARAAELVARFDLPDDTRYSELSRGQKSAASIVMAVASGCELLLLDEPYLGLDVAKREEFYRVLREESGRTIVLSTHHLHEAEKLLDTVLYIDAGEVLINGPIDDMSARFVQVSGNGGDVDRVLSRLGSVREMRREDLALGRRSVLDLQNHDLGIDDVVQAAGQVGPVQVAELTLENAVLAMTTSGDPR
ncbi:ABC transporter ATP-binding protein [Corynebacterium sp.]|uniref:ATP-binding cassette domain-containing protein n=1 Tax=Corynebacterium sp. TaxID=1720 RepID=UPI0026E0A6F8|nr:ABC transporter ATP-binding protein [Corynebacterium sp.]MDO5512202.1 ABC transporter ATP-binding protein [Corynebacterium sp.]